MYIYIYIYIYKSIKFIYFFNLHTLLLKILLKILLNHVYFHHPGAIVLLLFLLDT